MTSRKELIRYLKVLGFGLGSFCFLTSCNKKQRLQYQNMTQQEVIDDIENHGTDLEFMDFFPGYYKINTLNKKYLDNFFDDGNNLRSYDKLCTVEEFTEEMYGREIKFDDLRNATKNDKNLSDNIKSYIYKGIDNIEKANLGIDLGPLYYTLSGLKVEFINDKNGITGCYDPYSRTVILNKALAENDEVLIKRFYHEVFGHGMVVAYAKKDGKQLLCMNRIPMLYIDYLEYNSDVFYLGSELDEGFADIITAYALGETIDCSNSKWSYKEASYTLLYYLSISDVELGEYANKGLMRFLNKLVAKGYNELMYVIPQYDKVDRKEYYDLLYRTTKIYARIQQYNGKDIKSIVKDVYDLCLELEKVIVPENDPFKSVGEISTLRLPLQLEYDSRDGELTEYYDANGEEVIEKTR